VVANRFGEVVGYTVCNDVSSRSIEGENPLYLPQAKVYAGACALADGIRPAWEVPDAGNLSITCTVLRQEVVAWSAETSTAQLKRPPSELLSWLFRAEHHPQGVVLSTGTGIVPELDFTLQDGDAVEIVIAEVGRLRNVVARGADAFA
jgi:2-dehydro-3-deoxy-D-arabinonate dehydratase